MLQTIGFTFLRCVAVDTAFIFCFIIFVCKHVHVLLIKKYVNLLGFSWGDCWFPHHFLACLVHFLWKTRNRHLPFPNIDANIEQLINIGIHIFYPHQEFSNSGLYNGSIYDPSCFEIFSASNGSRDSGGQIRLLKCVPPFLEVLVELMFI